MNPLRKVLSKLLKYLALFLTNMVLRIDGKDYLKDVPEEGPLIITANHINFLEVPVVYPRILPRRATGFAKKEHWENPFGRFFFYAWEAIPLDREAVDTQAIRKALAALKDKQILAIAVEGTRSRKPGLLRAKPGVTIVALKSQSPILPLAYYGHEDFLEKFKRFKRTDFHIRTGTMFMLHDAGERVNSAVRQQMADEIMYQVAILMPEEYRGYYSDLSKMTTEYLKFLPEQTVS